MATATAAQTRSKGQELPRLLVVDADRRSGEAVQRACQGRLACTVVSARTLAEARAVLATGGVTLLLTELKLPDGPGTSLIDELRKCNPYASVVVTGASPRVDETIEAFRHGAVDFLPKPLSGGQVVQRLAAAVDLERRRSREDRRLQRLRQAVRKLSDARRTVARKVDLLCNDLVGAYGELSRMMDQLRIGEDFRKVCDRAEGLEQLLCHTMDWLMRRCGYANIAVFLATEEAPESAGGANFQLGAYVKYTVPSSPDLVDALRDGVVRRATQEGFVRLSSDEAEQALSAAELRHLRGMALVAANCTYLGESLATIVLFRGGDVPFTNDDADMFRAIAPTLAVALATQVRGGAGENDGEGGESPEPPRKDDRADADWWKRGEAPPF